MILTLFPARAHDVEPCVCITQIITTDQAGKERIFDNRSILQLPVGRLCFSRIRNGVEQRFRPKSCRGIPVCWRNELIWKKMWSWVRQEARIIGEICKLRHDGSVSLRGRNYWYNLRARNSLTAVGHDK